MKKYKITLKGTGSVYSVYDIIDVENFDPEEDLFSQIKGPYVIYALLSDIQVEVNGTPIRQKGKYIKTKNHFSRYIVAPSLAYYYDDSDMMCSFTVELDDSCVFNPMKLQLVKSDYELHFLPYAIIPDYIIYDGKKILADPVEVCTPEGDEIFCEEKICFSDFEDIDYKLPYMK